jgi:long-chain acyl-CoA synthetase
LKGCEKVFLSELLEQQKENKKIAIKYGANEITYKDWYNYSRRLSYVLNDNVAESSMNIALFLPNSINYALAYFSILLSKKIIVPIGTQSKGFEITNTLEYCEIDVIITSLHYRDFFKDCLSGYKCRITLLFIEDQRIENINDEKNS